jgi:hypothetical protein
MSSQMPHRIKDILAKPAHRRTPKECQRLRAWDRRAARDELARLEDDLALLADALVELGDIGPLVHDPRRPAFSKECRQGRPDQCHWYLCCSVVHPDPRATYQDLLQRVLAVRSLARAS